MAEITIDARGLKCPAPIMRLFVASKSAAAGDLLVATATDCAFVNDAEAWCKKTGNALESIDETGGEITARIRKK